MSTTKTVINDFNEVNKKIFHGAKSLFKIHKRRDHIFAELVRERNKQILRHKIEASRGQTAKVITISTPPIAHSKEILTDLKKIIRYEKLFHKKCESPVLELLDTYKSMWNQVNALPADLIEKKLGLSKEEYVHHVTIAHRLLVLFIHSIDDHKKLIRAEETYMMHVASATFHEVEVYWQKRLDYVEQFEELVSEIYISKREFLKRNIFESKSVNRMVVAGMLIGLAGLSYLNEVSDGYSATMFGGLGFLTVALNLGAVLNSGFENEASEERKLAAGIASFKLLSDSE